LIDSAFNHRLIIVEVCDCC